ncbi:predicted protein [Naegleria gruberi]|uniref:Predicted protein n=1 Tax=Naegleria gruberi TaxID=5762 RepID=D2VTG5_NAEGR|nr:uncharacterized protein NAEGRDRAFT_72292 [Naegleria gruberi]EFC39931.1 predicted protein [Naegleria gruberi]|eukprot:XP_002672675.1 predicted protein [Naegleria gruberi strain NEG-M]
MGNRQSAQRTFFDSDDSDDYACSYDSEEEYTRQGPVASLPIIIRETIAESLPEVNIKKQLIQVMNSTDRSGDFSTGGKLSAEYSIPAIEILQESGVYKPLPLPIIYEEQAKDLIKNCSMSPFGRLDKTIYDESVRKSWQLDPQRFKITNPKWNSLIEDLVNNNVKKDLGIAQEKKIGFSLYKMLLYEEGGFFDFHRDTEKENGMIATLVVQLPSSFTGGEIVVRHKEKENIYKTSEDATFNPYYVSFYCDVSHKVETVKSGYRLALIYNLVYSGADKIQAFDSDTQLKQIETIVKSWLEAPMYSKLCYVMDHKYSTAGLTPELLKGKDEAIYQLLKQIPNVETSLAILEKHERSCGSTVRDIEETKLYYQGHVVGQPINQKIHLMEDEIFPDDVRRSMPEENRDIETTGNEGATIERWYKSACIIMIPNELKSLEHKDKVTELLEKFKQNPHENTRRLLMALTSSKLTCSEDSECNSTYNIESKDILEACIALSYLPLSLKFIERLWLGGGLGHIQEAKIATTLIKHHGVENFKVLFDKYIEKCFKHSYSTSSEIEVIASLVLELEEPTWIEKFISNIPMIAASTYYGIKSDAIVLLLGIKDKYPSTSEKITQFVNASLKNDNTSFSADLIIRLNRIELCPKVFKTAFGSYSITIANVEQCIPVMKHFGLEQISPLLSQSLSTLRPQNMPSLISVLENILVKDGKEEQFLASKLFEAILEMQKKDISILNSVKLLTLCRKLGKTEDEMNISKAIVANKNYSTNNMYELVEGLAKNNGNECFWTGSGFRIILDHSYKLLHNAANSTNESLTEFNLGDTNKWKFTHIPVTCTCNSCLKVKQFIESSETVFNFKEKQQSRKHVEQILRNAIDIEKETIKKGSPQTLRLTKVLKSPESKKSLSTAIEQILKTLLQYGILSDQKPNSRPAEASASNEPPTKKIKQEQQ